MDKPKTLTIELENSPAITIETGQVARQANGSVVIRQGDTVIFSSACCSKEPLENIDFLPLRIDYQEKFSSAGKSLGGFIKREGKPSEKEVLVCRLIDRPIRPLFPEGYHHDVQVLSYVWSYDENCPPDTLAICAASAALCISEIPLLKPVAGVRVGYIDNKFVLNPSVEDQGKSALDLVLAGTEDAILMIEGFCDFLTEEQTLEAIEFGHRAIKTICKSLREWSKEVGKEKQTDTVHVVPEQAFKDIEAGLAPKIEAILNSKDKKQRELLTSEAKEAIFAKLLPEDAEEGSTPYTSQDLAIAFKKTLAKHMREMILSKRTRVDGRSLDEIRPISISQDFLPKTHGSSLFTRGETQSIAVCTLGSDNMGQRYETLSGEGKHNFYLQYSFPPFSVGEVGRVGPPGRREVGHGKLAERALITSIPSQDEFPYTIRLESNITESNGSSSMASVCGGCLAMMSAGVPVKRPVSGIAMGLILEGDNYAILSDILGMEDALGDMDFKVTGDASGITAFQMDIKIEGITVDIMKDALQQAKQGRVHILDRMLEACPKPKASLPDHAPRIETIQIHTSKIATVIGPGGKTIRSIIEQTGVEIDINDDGKINVLANTPDAMDKAKNIIEGLVAEVKIGTIYTGKVAAITAFGLFVEVLPGKEGLCHISEIANERIENIFDLFKVGDTVTVKVLDINERGQLKLSKKAAAEETVKS
ncbi:MAG: polyribonucleotide nucleotidyltransferase [Chlamydiales bacterium]|nr:polyribonucleotide nucleotidyltransferase [Chlamydiales bacterium]